MERSDSEIVQSILKHLYDKNAIITYTPIGNVLGDLDLGGQKLGDILTGMEEFNWIQWAKVEDIGSVYIPNSQIRPHDDIRFFYLNPREITAIITPEGIRYYENHFLRLPNSTLSTNTQTNPIRNISIMVKLWAVMSQNPLISGILATVIGGVILIPVISRVYERKEPPKTEAPNEIIKKSLTDTAKTDSVKMANQRFEIR